MAIDWKSGSPSMVKHGFSIHTIELRRFSKSKFDMMVPRNINVNAEIYSDTWINDTCWCEISKIVLGHWLYWNFHRFILQIVVIYKDLMK